MEPKAGGGRSLSVYGCFENFGKKRFTIDNCIFRVFVEIPIGNILALFDVFPATLRGGLGLDYGEND